MSDLDPTDIQCAYRLLGKVQNEGQVRLENQLYETCLYKYKGLNLLYFDRAEESSNLVKIFGHVNLKQYLRSYRLDLILYFPIDSFPQQFHIAISDKYFDTPHNSDLFFFENRDFRFVQKKLYMTDGPVFNLTTSLLQFVTIAEHCLFALYPDFGYKVHNVISSTSIANFMNITYFPYTELHIQKPLSSDPYGSSYLVQAYEPLPNHNYFFFDQEKINRQSSIYKIKPKDMCMKVLKYEPNQSNAFKCIQRELTCLTLIKDYPNMITFYGLSYTQEGNLCILTEYCSKGNLRDYLRENELDEIKRMKIIRLIIENVIILHKNHIIHQDLKPDNIYITNKDIPKIVNFSFSSRTKDTLYDNSDEETSQFGAPEAINSSILTPKSDIFSLGLIIQEIYLYTLSNEDRLPTEENVIQISNDRPVFKHIEKDVLDIILACTQENPDDRPSAEELLSKWDHL